MSRAINAIVIGIAVFILAAGSLWYVSVASGQDKLEVESTLAIGSVDPSRTRLVANLTFVNRHDVEVKLHGFEYRFRVDDMTLASNTTNDTLPLEPRSAHGEQFILDFPTSFVSEWLLTHTRSGEKGAAVFEGTATFQVGSRNQTIEFGDDHPFSTKIESSLEGMDNCPRPRPEPCLAEVAADWTERFESPALDVSLTFKNEVDREIKIDRPSAALFFGQTQVAQGEAGGMLLAGGGQEPAKFSLVLEHKKLIEWWPQHVNRCETSPVSLAVSFSYEVEPEDRETSTPSSSNVSTPPTQPTNTTTNTTTSSASPTTTTSEPAPTTTVTSSGASPTTYTVTSTVSTNEPSTEPPAPTTSRPAPVTTITSSGASPTTYTITSTPAGPVAEPPQLVHTQGPVRVTYVFAPQEAQDVENHTAKWDLEAEDFTTHIVCQDQGEKGLLELP